MNGEAAPRPLAGRRILVTRRREQASSLVDRLRGLGAEVIEVPALEVIAAEDPRPLDEALSNLGRYRWLLFTSSNAVRFVRERLDALGLDLTGDRASPRVGSVGPTTAAAIREAFPRVAESLEPVSDFRAEGLAATLEPIDVRGQRCLLPVSDRARDTLPGALRARGALVDVVVAYRTVQSEALTGRLATALEGPLDLVVFASPSAVEGYVAAAGVRAASVPAAVIGPVTEAAARAAGLDVAAVAHPSNVDGLVAAIANRLAR